MSNRLKRRIGVSISLSLTQLWCASFLLADQSSTGKVAQADPRAEVAAALYAASATQAAAERFADQKLRAQRVQIERLQTRVRAGAPNVKALQVELVSAQEKYVADLAAR